MSSVALEPRTPTVVVKPILYGNTAKHLGSKRDSDGHTHKWTVYVRSYNNEDDMSAYIVRVQFRLHESYSNNIRVIYQPPFVVEETGWGEFETQIMIFFTDPNEKPVIFYHQLKLFSSDADVIVGKKPLVNEYYDELMFQEPSDLLARALNRSNTFTASTSENRAVMQEYSMQKSDTIMRVKHARQRVRSEIQELTERLRVAQENIRRVRQRNNANPFSPGTFTSLPHENELED